MLSDCKIDSTYLDNIINFNLMMVRHEPKAFLINNATSQGFLMGGCVKLNHDSNKRN